MDWSESHYSRDTAMRLARAGALVTIACAPDACKVCRSRTGRIYIPSEVPRLPIRGCLNERCRCRFVAVDPESERTVPELVQEGAQALKAGQAERAEQVLRRAVALDEMYEQGWLWLSGAVDDDQDKVACMEKVLAINPQNKRAQAGLALLRKQVQAPHAALVSQPAPTPPQDESSLPMEPEPQGTTPELTSLPPEVIKARQERRVIQEQWNEFLDIAVATDPQMVTMQGLAFLKKIKQLNVRALEKLPLDMRLDELYLQWQESETLGQALAGAIRDPNHVGTPGWEEMDQALRLLAQKLLEHHHVLSKQISAIESPSP